MHCGYRALTAVSMLTVLSLAPAIAAQSPLAKLDSPLSALVSDTDAEGEAAVIVQTTPDALRMGIDQFCSAGGTLGCAFRSIDAFSGSMPAGRLAELAALPWVERISSDVGVRKMLDVAAPAVGAPVAWNRLGCTGKGVSVAVIDSGIAFHLDFSDGSLWWRSRIVGGYDWIQNSPWVFSNDRCGHGTSVAGAIAGNGRYSTNVDPTDPRFSRTFTGIAPEASIVNCRVLDAEGVGRTSDVISAVEWCVANAKKLNIRVINLSLGHPIEESYETDPLCRVCEHAWLKGIAVVVAAGNSGSTGYSSILSPANDPLVISVGAINTKGTPELEDDEVCGYSSRGPTRIDHTMKPDLVAPGNRIVSARHYDSLLERSFASSNLVSVDYYKIDPSRWDRSAYFVFSGTSMSAGIVSGACALMAQRDPSLTPDTIKRRLMLTARRSPDYGRLWQGAGYISIPDALRSSAVALAPERSWRVFADESGRAVVRAPLQVARNGNIIWDPVPPEPPPEGMLVYLDDPANEAYQPPLDPNWSADGTAGWASFSAAFPTQPEAACQADVSRVAVFGEDEPLYAGTHGPLPATP